MLADVATTYIHNLTRPDGGTVRFERQAVSDRLALSALPQFKDFLDREGQEFLERIDTWLTEHEVKDEAGGPGADAIRLGVGMYHIQD